MPKQQLTINVYEPRQKTVEVEFPFYRQRKDYSEIEKVFGPELFVSLCTDKSYFSLELYHRSCDVQSDNEDAILGHGAFVCSEDEFKSQLLKIRNLIDDLLEGRVPVFEHETKETENHET